METGRTISLTQEQKTGVSKTAKLKEMRRGYDSLTGMMGRRLFLLKTQQMLHQHPDLQFVMVRADMDHFRVYNSFFGVAAGDELLRRIADFVRQFTAHLDICTYGHIGADVFCVCCPYREGLLEASIEESCRTVQGLNPNYYLRANYGIYLITPGEDDMERIYTRASEAARYCKRSYNRNYVFYDEKMREAGRWEQWVINEMEGALRTGQFQVYLQPRYLLRSKKPCGLEALVRWQHPTNGLIMPDKFISIFERSGFIIRLDRYMLDQAGGLLRSWLDDGDMVVPISVNISQISLYDPQLVDYLVEVSQQYQLPDGLLQLEVTESAYMSNPEMMGTLIDQLHAHHFTILMDDFGKGYSSLNTLKNIDVDLLKIDMAFLPTGEKNVKSEKILASIIRMASWLNMNVLVEGVETETQEAFLMSVGCKYAQGYYFARPMPVSDWEKVQHSAGAETSTFKDLDAIWSSDETTNSLLNGIAVPFAICMYADRHGEALRRNDAFLNEFGLDWEKTSMVPDEKEKLDDACAWAVERQNTAECECLFAGGNGGTKWFRIKIQYIRQVRDFYVLSLTFSEITDERVLGRQVNQISRPSRAVGQKRCRRAVTARRPSLSLMTLS